MKKTVKKQKAPGGGLLTEQAFLGGGANQEQYTPSRFDCQAVNNLLSQADSRMAVDPARAGLHFLIWLSFNALKFGYPWPGQAGHG